MSGHLPFSVEYAKTGRSKCKGCKEVIGKDSLRLAKVVKSPFHDGVMPSWFHRDCFFKKNHPKAVTEIENFDNIRWEDQQSLKTEIEPQDLPSTAGADSQNSLKRNHSINREFTIEYALSNRSKCIGCDNFIPKGFIRIMKVDTESTVGARYQGVNRYYHLDCFVKLRESLNFYSSPETIQNFEKLTEDDKRIVEQKLPEIENPEGPSTTKKAKPCALDPHQEEIIKEQSEKLFKIRNDFKDFSRDDLASLLRHNNQFVPKGEAEILNEVCDRMLFGSLKPCKKCKEDFHFVSGIGYECQGYLTEWTKCGEVTDNPERIEFKIPDYLISRYQFSPTYPQTVSHRILRLREPPTPETVKKEVKKPEQKVDCGPMPLKDMVFVIAGRTMKTKEDLKKEIMLLGGTVTSKMRENVSAVIASKETLDKKPKVIKDAENYQIQVVTEDFVDKAKDYKVAPITLITTMNIATWGEDPNKRIATKQSSSKNGANEGKIMLKLKGGGTVDPESGLENVAHVFEDGDGKYSVLLVNTDIKAKKNSYYKMQILKHDTEQKFYLFKSWGRIGTTAGGKTCDELFKRDCFYEFRDMYFKKTGNFWYERHIFEKKPGKMYELDTVDDSDEADEIDSGIPSNLEEPVQKLMKLLSDEKVMNVVMKEYELDTEKMPLGKLSKKQLLKAHEVLKGIQELLANGNPDRGLLIDASNRFYTLVPHSFGDDEPTIIDNDELIKSKCEMLDTLIEMEFTYNLLKGKTDEKENKIDSYYKRLNTDINVLDRESDEFKIIEEYTKNTHSHIHNRYELIIEDVFVIKRLGERERYEEFKKLGNRKLLWHGSRTTNFVGILSQGLRIAPPEAPSTGYMFGKGIYFADMVSKSANYCCTSSIDSTGLLLLCEVALGRMYERYSGEYIEQLPESKSSTLGIGQLIPDPKKVYTTSDGVEVPYGCGVPNDDCDLSPSLLHNEYIVYNVAQVNMKYLIRMNFKYKKN